MRPTSSGDMETASARASSSCSRLSRRKEFCLATRLVEACHQMKYRESTGSPYSRVHLVRRVLSVPRRLVEPLLSDDKLNRHQQFMQPATLSEDCPSDSRTLFVRGQTTQTQAVHLAVRHLLRCLSVLRSVEVFSSH